jgi:DHA1 family multidrug resistance protein-like MFS transporter
MAERIPRNVLFLSLSQFGMAFCFNFVMVFIPFFIHRISPYSTEETLLWIGLIMGAPSLMAALASTFWGSLTARFSPRLLFLRGLISHAVLILLMGFTTSLPLLLFLRVLQGIMGGISTVGFIIVSASSPQERVSRDIGFYQNSMTLGQLAGPPAGALAASLLGYQGAFLGASALVFVTLAFCLSHLTDVPRRAGDERAGEQRTISRRTLTGWLICFAATTQLMFLPSVLPSVFAGYGIGRDIALRWAGLVIMGYTATAVVGTYLLCKLTPRIRTTRLIAGIVFLATLLQSLLSLSPGMVSFAAIRMAQTALIAATLPLVISLFAAQAKGGVIGFLNSGRFAGNGLGPMIATTVLAATDLATLYLAISGLTLLGLLGFTLFFDKQSPHPHPTRGETGPRGLP